MKPCIQSIGALEILDSRGNPTVRVSVLNGGKHADSGMDFQEFIIFPIGAPTFAEALRYGTETFHALHKILVEKSYSTSCMLQVPCLKEWSAHGCRQC